MSKCTLESLFNNTNRITRLIIYDRSHFQSIHILKININVMVKKLLSYVLQILVYKLLAIGLWCIRNKFLFGVTTETRQYNRDKHTKVIIEIFYVSVQ